jgi:leucine dehydrogenase
MSVWASREFDDHEQVCFFSDEKTGLRAIVAIHSTFLGPALGGTRFKSYDEDDAALDDALRLSRAMSYKSALAGLPVGGGKAVIIGDPERIKTRALLHAFGRFIDRIGNTFATGEDVGITVADIDTVSEVTRFVGGTSVGVGDPSVHTAVGLLHGLRAVLESQFRTDSFAGVRVAVQGLGAVGWRVAERLHAAGAQLVVADIRPDVVTRAVHAFDASSLPTQTIHSAEVDIYTPCALGGVITESSVGEIRAKAVAGAANNQLATPSAGAMLAERGILFAPDFVINAGGILSGLEAASRMPGRKTTEFAPLEARLAAIHDRLAEIFRRSRADGRPPEVTAERMAREIIGR